MVLVVFKKTWYCTTVVDSQIICRHSGRKLDKLLLTCSHSFKAQSFLERDRFKTVKKKLVKSHKWPQYSKNKSISTDVFNDISR